MRTSYVVSSSPRGRTNGDRFLKAGRPSNNQPVRHGSSSGRPRRTGMTGRRPAAVTICATALVVSASYAQRASPDRAPRGDGARPREVTFTRDVAPIVFSACASCHRPAGVAPFSLLTYQDAKSHAAQIVAATRDRVMPPWKPEPGYGQFADERRPT